MGNCLPCIDHTQSTSTQAAPAGATAAERIPSSRGHSFPSSSTFSVLQRVSENCKQLYKLGAKLGEGQFGTTYLCIERSSGSRYACKCIRKRKLTSREKEDVWREVRIMHHLSGHPHIVNIRDAYEDSAFVYLVMELCAGGDLFDRIVQRGHYSEREAARLIRTIVSVVESCHSLGVMHRDLKPENFLFSDNQEASLKAIDFGLSVFFKPGEVFKDRVGTPLYIAPEVLQKSYGPQADIWSVGVILYILLCGRPPFSADSEQRIFERVLLGVLDFKSNPWPQISESAKDLIRNMLNLNPQGRFTAYQVLCHPWICEDGVAPDRPLDPAILSRMKQFMAMNKMKKIALRIIAQKCSEEEIAGLKEAFKMIDADGNGTITFDELKDGLQRMGSSLHDNEVHTLMEAADVDKNGIIDYEEFIAATLNLNQLHKEENLVAAFKYFDLDGNGLITIDELRQVCIEHRMGDAEIQDVIKEIDQNNDGYIDYDEFVSMMQKANGVLGRRLF